MAQFTRKNIVIDDIFARCEPLPWCGCWIWMGADNGKPGDLAHGKVRFRGEYLYVHRVAWMLENGRDVPDGLVVDHTCKIRMCCNPAHLEAVTQFENICRGDNPMAPALREQRYEEPAPLDYDPFELVD